jgi:hypothetical protein
LSDRRKDEALLWALLVPICRNRPALGVILILLDHGLGLWLGGSVTQDWAIMMGKVYRCLAAHRRRTLVAGTGGVVFGRGRGDVHLWMRGLMLVSRAELLRLGTLGLIPGRAERILSSHSCGRGIVVVTLGMLRVGLVFGWGSGLGGDDGGGRWRVRVVVVVPWLLLVLVRLTRIGHVDGRM